MNGNNTERKKTEFLREKIIFLSENNSKQISLDNLHKLMNGSKEQMIRMTTVFQDQIEKHFNEIKFVLIENNLDQISNIPHKLISSFKLFGLKKTGVLLERIEQRAKTIESHDLNSELQLILNMQPRLTYLVQKELNQLILSHSNS